MSTVAEEHVLVIPTSEFHSLGHFQGFSRDLDTYLPAILDSEHLSYRPRSEMEKDPSFKQLIPYVLFRYTDEKGIVHSFQYTRGNGQGEARLHTKRSVGIGGHISTDDSQAGTPHDVYRVGMLRELEEEVAIDTPFREQCIGLINDDQTPVGRVHLGVVHLFDVEAPHVTPREDEILESGFHPVSELLPDLVHFETWSQIVLRALYA